MQTNLLLLLVCVPLIGAVASSPVALADDGKPTPKEVADLCTAIEAKDWTGALEQIENKRVLVHAKRGDRGNSPLLYAARDGELAAVRAILKLGADVNARNTNGQTALHAAAGKGHKEIVALLLANKAEIEARTKRKMTPLYYAAYAGRTGVTDYLVDKGASPKDFAFYVLARSGSPQARRSTRRTSRGARRCIMWRKPAGSPRRSSSSRRAPPSTLSTTTPGVRCTAPPRADTSR